MEPIPLGEVELRYTSLASVDYGAGGQFYGTMEGWLHGDALRGDLRLTNLAPRRPDNVNMPAAGAAWSAHDRGDALRARGITPRLARRGIDSRERLGQHRWVVK